MYGDLEELTSEEGEWQEGLKMEDRFQQVVDDERHQSQKASIDQYIQEFRESRPELASLLTDATIMGEHTATSQFVSRQDAKSTAEVSINSTVHWQASAFLTNKKYGQWRELVEKSPALKTLPPLSAVGEKHVLHALA